MQEKSIGANLPPVLALAFLGDARHSLFIRKMLVKSGIAKSGELNTLAQKYVTAEAQAEAFARIEGHLTEDELGVFRRAFNSTHLNKPKRASGADYRAATGFEAVLGMLYFIGDEERLNLILDTAHGKLNDN